MRKFVLHAEAMDVVYLCLDVVLATTQRWAEGHVAKWTDGGRNIQSSTFITMSETSVR